MKYAIVKQSTNQIVNIIQLNPDAIWESPKNHTIVASEDARIGDYWVQNKFYTPEEYASL